MRVRYKPWAEDYLKDHPELVDMDGQHAGKMTEWFDKTQPIHIEIGSYGAVYYNISCSKSSY